MKHNINHLLFIFLQCVTTPALPIPVHTLEGMVGEQPELLCWLMTQFNTTRSGNNAMFLNRLLLYGPPGNGKSMIAKQCAQTTNSILIARSACSMVERYVGQGATNVLELFAKARELHAQTNQKIVLFIDEIDALAAGNNSEFRAEHKAALQQLWIELDQCKHDPYIFVIFATNEFKKLSKTFLDRFGCNTIEIKMPDVQLRAQILAHYFSKAQLTVPDSLITQIAQHTEGLSIRSLEDMVYGIKIAVDIQHDGVMQNNVAWNALEKIKEKYAVNTADEEAQEKKWQKINTLVSIISGSLSSVLNSYYLAAIIAALCGITYTMPTKPAIA